MPFFDHDNLDVELRDVGGEHAVKITSTAGEFFGSFKVPFAPFEADNFLLQIGVRTGIRRAAPKTDSEQVREFGTRLFEALFHGDLEHALRASLRSREGRGVRVRLRLRDAPELVALPWEYLYDPEGARPLSISTQTPLVRYVDMGNPVRTLRVSPPLRVLVVTSSPAGVEQLDAVQEFQDLQAALRDQVTAGRVEIHGLHRATPARLRDELGTDAFHVVHFVGHGAFDESTGTGMVLLEDDHGAPLPISGHDLGLVLHDHDQLRMVVLNACEGGRGSTTNPIGGVAQSMVHHDIPAVIGMQAEITDEAAVAFSEAFYRHLGQGAPVDVAMAEARMKLRLGHGAEWGIPLLYLRAHDGRIFDLVEEPAPSDVGQLEEQADRLVAAGGAAERVVATGLYQRVEGLAPERAEVRQKLATMQDDVPPPPPGGPQARPAPPTDSPVGWVPTPRRAARMLARVGSVLDDAQARLPPEDGPAVAALAEALEEPLRIAVAGQRRAGKSALVNALLGARLAPSSGTPRSAVLTWYRHGPERASLVTVDGVVVPVGTGPTGPAERLPVPVEQVERLEVWMPLPSLRRHTLVDTPSSALEVDGPAATVRSLFGHSIGPGGEPIVADALLFVFRGPPTDDELTLLGRRLDARRLLASGALNAMVVLNLADLAAGGPWGEGDPLEVADAAARALSGRLPAQLDDVRAVSALMAEVARTGRTTPEDAALLAELSGASRDELAAAVGAGGGAGPADPRIRALADRVTEYALVRGRHEAAAGASHLAAWMDRRSGVPALENAIRTRLLGRAAAIKADHALEALATIAERRRPDHPEAAAAVGAAIERARAHRDLHPIREIDALARVSGINAELHRDLLRVSGAGSIPERVGADVAAPAEEIIDRALRKASAAQRTSNVVGDPRARAAARVLSTSYRVIADEARALRA